MQSIPKYSLNSKGQFVVEDYNNAKPFSNFFPGIAGIWGIPMWVFYVNRGQCIASFGVQSKDYALMEFQPANKSYRLTSLQGFRTFIKAKANKKEVYWEPFQNNLLGTDFKKQQTLYMSAHDLTIEEKNLDLGLTARVNYFTLCNEPFSGLIRNVCIQNNSRKNYHVKLLDGLPYLNPYGLKDWLNKNLSRTVEAWIKVNHLRQKTPYYRLNVQVSDTPQVTHIEEGNFFLSLDQNGKNCTLLDPIVEGASIFGQSHDLTAPSSFLDESFVVPKQQQTQNRTPCAFSYVQSSLKKNSELSMASLFGFARGESHLQKIIEKVKRPKYLLSKQVENEQLITHIKNYALTNSSSPEFNLYCGQTFLDNILRGGLPVSLKHNDEFFSFNVYSRKHGDLERDYNHFTVAPTFYSQGNGNYRDVNQNRRNDCWFNEHVKEHHLINFLNLIQVDGYNPLVVKGTSFAVEDKDSLDKFLNECVSKEFIDELKSYLNVSFLPGDVLAFIDKLNIELKVDEKQFLGRLLSICRVKERADHGEGFWSDHWTYNLDLLESYLSIYPDHLEDLLFHRKEFSFYQNSHYVLPRDQRYILTESGVRQYKAVAADPHNPGDDESRCKTMQGKGVTYYTSLIVKLLCLIANKTATFDPSGIGIAMEADKPGWYDALNGLPGLSGSSLSETLELKRLCSFLLETLKQCSVEENEEIALFEELATFMSGLAHLCSIEEDAFSYWMKSNDIKEHYRSRTQTGIDGEEKPILIRDIKNFLSSVIKRCDLSVPLAQNKDKQLGTYFIHEVIEYTIVDKSKIDHEPHVFPKKFQRHDLPLYLEGYVHALKVCEDKMQAKKLYGQVKKSPLFDQKLKMYKVNIDLSEETEEIGRCRIFPRGWLENESIWLHMEYKYLLEILRSGLVKEFYDDFKNCMIPFQNPAQYGRSILENSSFIVSSAHEDQKLHGQGFVARLSGSTAEFMHIWLYMNCGPNPFILNAKKELNIYLRPLLAGWLFTKIKSKVRVQSGLDKVMTVNLPANTYSFSLFNHTLVVYHNPRRKDTFGKSKANIDRIELSYPKQKNKINLSSAVIPAPYSYDIRDRKVNRIDIYYQ